MLDINNMSEEEFDKCFPEETCPKHGKYRAVCMKCEDEWEAFVSQQEAKDEFRMACRRDNRKW